MRKQRYKPSRAKIAGVIAVDETAVILPLSQGIAAIVDEEDFDRLVQFKWSAGWINSGWYGLRWTKERMVYLHRFIMSAEKGQLVDHIDGNTLDCRKVNMRITDNLGNSRNRCKVERAGNSSRFKGVRRTPNGRWVAQIKVDGRQFHLGRFDREEDAAIAYNGAAERHFGDFARLNVLEESE